jgi:UDPglucose 6-dehydrogenase
MGVGATMKICVFGLWHLGSVTAACLANKGFDVVGLDLDEKVILDLSEGKAPIHEPGLDDLLNKGLEHGNLTFTNSKDQALKGIDALWFTYDTPVDEDDNADVDFVEQQLISVMDKLPQGARVIISSQVPVGFTGKMEKAFRNLYPDKKVTFAYSPENLRLGKAIQIFENPDRIVVGVREVSDRPMMEPIFGAITDRIEWMGTESSEMTKHAINAFLATSVTFANELASLCEKIGANAKDVERGLKTEERIGPKAYLGPGAAFAGGTLARDILFLTDLGNKHDHPTYVIRAVKESNDFHKGWIKRKLVELIGDLKGKTIAVLGLTYKPGTDTLRRSLSVELCKWLKEQETTIQAFDPKIQKLPDELVDVINLKSNIDECLHQADCLLISTEWPIFREELTPERLNNMRKKVVLDANGFLEKQFLNSTDLQYAAVGRELK